MARLRSWILMLAFCAQDVVVIGHMRLDVPPGRSTLWRYGFDAPVNYEEAELFCGGFEVQWNANGGKCGVCGDAYHIAPPRDNEAGGKYGLGIISRKYISGQILDATVYILANHKGYLEFKLCPNNNPKVEVTQECLDKHVLNLAYSEGTKFDVAGKGDHHQITVSLKLPDDLICSQCVLQFTSTSGNRWSRCENGTEAVGCPPEQEMFRACADIAIVHADETVSPAEEEDKDTSKDVLIPLLYNKATDDMPNNSFQLLLKFSREKLLSLGGDEISSVGNNTEDNIFYDDDRDDKSNPQVVEDKIDGLVSMAEKDSDLENLYNYDGAEENYDEQNYDFRDGNDYIKSDGMYND